MLPTKQHNMTRKVFNSLNFKDKLKTILKTGNFIDTHITSVGDSLITNLYKLNLFHVEVVYSGLGTSIKEINSFKMGSTADRYFPQKE